MGKMIFTNSQIYHFILITLVSCCLSNSVAVGKLPKSRTHPFNNTELAASAKEIVAVAVADADAAAVPINETDNKSSEEDDDYTNLTADKSAIQMAADTSLSFWGIARSLWNWIKEDIRESLFGGDAKTLTAGERRTFGRIRRMQMALIPIIFKFGVLSAMIAFLVGLGVKTLFLVKVLIVLNLLALVTKFFTLKSNLDNFEHVSAYHHPLSWKWSPYMSDGWHSAGEQHHVNKEIHLHIHGAQVQPQVTTYSHTNSAGGGHSQRWERRIDPYSAYGTIALRGQQNQLISNELASTRRSVVASGQQLITSFPGNHRML